MRVYWCHVTAVYVPSLGTVPSLCTVPSRGTVPSLGTVPSRGTDLMLLLTLLAELSCESRWYSCLAYQEFTWCSTIVAVSGIFFLVADAVHFIICFVVKRICSFNVCFLTRSINLCSMMLCKKTLYCRVFIVLCELMICEQKVIRCSL